MTFASRGEKGGENGYFLIAPNEQFSLHALQLCNLRRRMMTARLRRHRGVSLRCATSPYSDVQDVPVLTGLPASPPARYRRS